MFLIQAQFEPEVVRRVLLFCLTFRGIVIASEEHVDVVGITLGGSRRNTGEWLLYYTEKLFTREKAQHDKYLYRRSYRDRRVYKGLKVKSRLARAFIDLCLPDNDNGNSNLPKNHHVDLCQSHFPEQIRL